MQKRFYWCEAISTTHFKEQMSSFVKSLIFSVHLAGILDSLFGLTTFIGLSWFHALTSELLSDEVNEWQILRIYGAMLDPWVVFLVSITHHHHFLSVLCSDILKTSSASTIPPVLIILFCSVYCAIATIWLCGGFLGLPEFRRVK